MIDGDGTPLHIVQATPATLAVQYAAAGVAGDPGVVTVTITRRDGTALVTAGATGGTDTDPRTYALSAAQTATLDALTAVWHSATLGDLTTRAEIVGAPLFTVAQARAFGKGSLADGTKYPESAILAARARILDDFRQVCGVAFVPRAARVELDGDGSPALRLGELYIRRIVAVEYRAYGSASYAAVSGAELAGIVIAPGGVALKVDGSYWLAGRRNYRIAFEYGYDAPPLAVQRAALTLATSQLVPSDFNERATAQTNELGTFRLAVAGWRDRSYYGIPSVDAVLARYDETVPGIG